MLKESARDGNRKRLKRRLNVTLKLSQPCSYGFGGGGGGELKTKKRMRMHTTDINRKRPQQFQMIFDSSIALSGKAKSSFFFEISNLEVFLLFTCLEQ